MKAATAIVVLVLLLVPPAGAQNAGIEFSYGVLHYPHSEIVDSLMAGHRSEVRYEMRLFKKVSGIRRIFGDILIHREEITYVARWDALNELFVVLIDGTQEETFDESELFLEFLFTLKDFPVPVDSRLTGDEYLLCRSRIQPIKLVPPLTLMTLIKSDLQTISDWERTPFTWLVE